MDTTRQRKCSPPPSSSPSSPDLGHLEAGDGYGFVDEVSLEKWVRSGSVQVTGALLVTRDGRRFTLKDAVRVLGPRSAELDPYSLTGGVEPLRDLLRKGATLGGHALRLGAVTYDVEFGVVLCAIGEPFALAASA